MGSLSPESSPKTSPVFLKRKIEDIREQGVVVVKNVFPEKGSLAMRESLKKHMKRNSLAKGFPRHDFIHCLKLRNSTSPAYSPVVYELQ